MPRVSDRFLYCAVYLYMSRDHAEAGEAMGGAGFFVGVPEEAEEPLVPYHAIIHEHRSSTLDARDAPHHLYVVSNRHVARTCRFVRLTRRDGEPEVFEVGEWCQHETSDVAVVPIEWKLSWAENYEFYAVSYRNFLSIDDVYNLDVGPGDDTFMVGRFITHDGQERNLPVVRFGNIAMLPLKPIEFLNEGMQNAFLVESRTVPGYSGSPVFLNIPPWELRESGKNNLRGTLGKALRELYETNYYTRLLGVVAAYLPDARDDNSGMTAVVPAWELLELLNNEVLREQRRTEAEKWRER